MGHAHFCRSALSLGIARFSCVENLLRQVEFYLIPVFGSTGRSFHSCSSILALSFCILIYCIRVPGESFYLTGVWRNGSASDSRSEGWEFESLCPHFSNLVDIPLEIPRSMVSCFGDSALNVGLGSTARLRAQSARRHVRTECPQLKFVCAPITSGFLYTALWPNG